MRKIVNAALLPFRICIEGVDDSDHSKLQIPPYNPITFQLPTTPALRPVCGVWFPTLPITLGYFAYIAFYVDLPVFGR